MRRVCKFALVLILIFGLISCSQNIKAQWQEQYDLGVRYLSEGNYEEAIIAFTAAIEIDAKRPEGYIGRGDAYVLSGDTEENLSAALADYEAALDQDETMTDAWLGLADVYIRQGDFEKAEEILREALEILQKNDLIQEKLQEFSSDAITDTQGRERKNIWRSAEGAIESYYVTYYDEAGRGSRVEYFDAKGTLQDYEVLQYFEDGYRSDRYSADDQLMFSDVHIELQGDTQFYSRVESYDGEGNLTGYTEYGENKTQHYGTNGELTGYELYEYNDDGQRIRWLRYDADGQLRDYYVTEYDLEGNQIRYTHYDAEGNRQISRRIKRPPSQRISNEMAVSIFIMV